MALVELILLTNGQLEQNLQLQEAEVTYLLGGYAVAVLP